MSELTDREKEFELLGIGINDLENLLKTRSANDNIPITAILVDWLELAQYQLEDKYRNVHHMLNRVIYALYSGIVLDNAEWKDQSKKQDTAK
ncbi:MAG: hypothetical protein ACHQ6U_03910 [Thermodesulfobacteriota bacterium]